MVKLRYVLFGLCFFLLLPGIEMYLLRKLNLVHTFEDVSKTVDYEFYGKITNINTKGRGMCINIENNVNIITNAFVTIEGEMKINDSIDVKIPYNFELKYDIKNLEIGKQERNNSR